MDFVLIGVAAVFGLYMAWNIGANDVANSMAASVGSRSISIKKAIIAAGICEFAGSVLVGVHVTDTVRKGIVDPSAIAAVPGFTQGDVGAIIVIGMTATLLSAAFWLNASTFIGMPVSTTHSIVGAVAGFGIVAAGWHSVDWDKMMQVVASWFLSPVAGGILAFFLFKFISRFILGRDRPVRAARTFAPLIVFIVTCVLTLATIYKGLKHVIKGAEWLTEGRALVITLVVSLLAAVVTRMIINHRIYGKMRLPLHKQLLIVERIFMPIVVISSCTVAFAHGANDVANAIGPLAAVVHILQTGAVDMKVGVPVWVLALGGGGIVLGLTTFGFRVMETVGTKITEITPSRGVAANLAATTTVLVCTRMALPVSTTHTLVGAVIGVGIARGLGGINLGVTKKIFMSWILTVPIAAISSMLLFLLGKHFFFDMVKSVVVSAGG